MVTVCTVARYRERRPVAVKGSARRVSILWAGSRPQAGNGPDIAGGPVLNAGGDAGELNPRSSEVRLRILLQAFPPIGISQTAFDGGPRVSLPADGLRRWLSASYRGNLALVTPGSNPTRSRAGADGSAFKRRERVRDWCSRLLFGHVIYEGAAILGLLSGYLPSCRFLSSPQCGRGGARLSPGRPLVNP